MVPRFTPDRLPQDQINAKIAANKSPLAAVPMAPNVATPTPAAPFRNPTVAAANMAGRTLPPAPAPIAPVAPLPLPSQGSLGGAPSAPRFTPDRLPQDQINANLEAARLRTSTGAAINPRTGGLAAPPPPIDQPATPALPVNPYQDDVSDAEQAYRQSLQMTPEEMQTQEQYDNTLAATRLGTNRIEDMAGGRGIPLSIMRGQQAQLERQGLLLAEPLEKKLARQQAQRIAALNASKFSLDRADKLSEQYQEEQVRKEGIAKQDAAAAQARKDQALQFAFENDISTPFFRHNGTIYRTSDLKLIGTPEEADKLGVAKDGSNVSDLKRQITPKDQPASVQEYEYARANGYAGSFNDYQNEDANRKATIAGYGGMSTQQSQQFLTITNKYQSDAVINQADKAQTAVAIADQVLADPNSATNQLKALYTLVKNLDADSAVREGELALVQQAQSYFQQFSTSLTRLLQGQIIAPEVARDLALATKDLAQAWTDTAQRRTGKYVSQANQLGIGQQFQDYLGGSTGYGTPPGGGDNDPLGLGFNQGGSGPANAQAVIGKAQPSPITLAVAKKYPVGSTGGQCTTFLHKIADFPPIGDGKNQKFASVDKFGIPKAQWQPRVGDIIVTDDNENYGHTMLLTLILPGNRGQVTESNWKGNEKVTHSRIVNLGGSNIYGAIRPKQLKTTFV